MTSVATARALRIRKMRRRICQNLLKQCRADYDAGNRGALADAVYYCSAFGQLLPNWAANAWIKGYWHILNLEVVSWHELLANKSPLEGKALTKERIKAKQRRDVIRYAPDDVPIDRDPEAGFFKRIADKTGLTPRQAKERYYELPSHVRAELRPPTRKRRRS